MPGPSSLNLGSNRLSNRRPPLRASLRVCFLARSHLSRPAVSRVAGPRCASVGLNGLASALYRVPRRKYHDRGADFHLVVEIDRVLVGHADAPRRDRAADIFRLIGAVDPVQRVLVALVEIQRSRAHRIMGTWAYVIRNIGKSVDRKSTSLNSSHLGISY